VLRVLLRKKFLAVAIGMKLTENGGDYVIRGFTKKRNDQMRVTTVVISRRCKMDWIFPSERKKYLLIS